MNAKKNYTKNVNFNCRVIKNDAMLRSKYNTHNTDHVELMLSNEMSGLSSP